MTTWHRPILTEEARQGTFTVPAHYTSGEAIGIITVDLAYPKLPGNVANATTFPFPVRYHKVEFAIERLFAGDPTLVDVVVGAARELERLGCRAIVGACGFFAHFQQQVAAAVNVPVFLSSLAQVPTVRLCLKPQQRIAVLAADAPSITPKLLAGVGAQLDDLVVCNVGDLESFAPIRWDGTTLDNGALTADLQRLAQEVVSAHPEVGAFLLECSDLPPYAADIQAVTGLPVFDFITLIKWVHTAVVQQPYYGWL